MANEELTRSQYLRALYEQRRLLNANSSVYVNPSVTNQVDIQANNSQQGFDFSFANNMALKEKEQEIKDLDKTEEQRRNDSLSDFASFVDKIVTGFVGGLEGIADAAGLIGIGFGKLFGLDTTTLEETVRADQASLYGSLAGNAILGQSNKVWEDMGDMGTLEYINSGGKYATFDSTLDTGFGKFSADTLGTIANMVPSMMLGYGSKALTLATLGSSAAGQGGQQALNEGATGEQALAYGAIKGGIEVGTELFVGKLLAKIPAIGKIFDGIGKGAINGVSVSSNIVSSGIASKLLGTMLEEGAEEVASDLLAPFAEAIYKGSSALSQYGTGEYWKEVLKSFLQGAITGGIMETTQKGLYAAKYSREGLKLIELQGQYQELVEEAKKYATDSTEFQRISNQMAQVYGQMIDAMKNFQELHPRQFEKFWQAAQYGSAEEFKQSMSKPVMDVISEVLSENVRETTNLKNFSIEIADESQIKEVKNDDGTFSKPRASYDPKTQTVTVNSAYLDKFSDLIKHEVISHAIYDASEEATKNLTKFIESDPKLKNEFEKYDSPYKNVENKSSTYYRERLARFIENKLTDPKAFAKIFNTNKFARTRVARILRSIINKFRNIKGSNKLNNEIIKNAQNALNNLKPTNEVVYSKSKSVTGNYTIGDNKLRWRIKKTATGYDIYENGKVVQSDLTEEQVRELLEKHHAKKVERAKTESKAKTEEAKKTETKKTETKKTDSKKKAETKKAESKKTATKPQTKVEYKVTSSKPVKVGKKTPVYVLTSKGEILVKTIEKVGEKEYIVKTRNKATGKTTKAHFDSYKEAKNTVMMATNKSNSLKEINQAKYKAEHVKPSKVEIKSSKQIQKVQETIDNKVETRDTWEGKYIAGDNKLAYRVVKTSTGYDIYEKSKLLKGYEGITLDELQKFLTENKLRRQAYKQAEERRTKAQEDRAKKTVLGRWLINDGKDELKVNKYQGKYQVHNRNEIIGEYENADQVRAYMQEARAEKYVNLQPKRLNDRFYISRNRTIYVKDGSNVLSKVLAKSDNGFIVTTTNLGDGDVWTKEFTSEKAAKNAIDTFTIKSYKQADVEKAIASQEQNIKAQTQTETKQERKGKKAKAETKVETKPETEEYFKTVETTEDIIKGVKKFVESREGKVQLAFPKNFESFTSKSFTELNSVKKVDVETRKISELLMESTLRAYDEANNEWVKVNKLGDVLSAQEKLDLEKEIKRLIESSTSEKAKSAETKPFQVSIERLANKVTKTVSKTKETRLLTNLRRTIKATLPQPTTINRDNVSRNGLDFMLYPIYNLKGQNTYSQKGVIQNFNEVKKMYEEIGKNPSAYPDIPYYPEVSQMIDDVIDSIGEPTRRADGVLVYGNMSSQTEHLIRMYGETVKFINNQVKAKIIQNYQPSAIQTLNVMANMKYGTRTDIFAKLFRSYKRGFAPSYYELRQMFGGNSRVAQLLTTDYQNAQNSKQVYYGAYSDAIKAKLKELGIKRQFNKRQFNVNGSELTTDQAMYLYISSNVEANFNAMDENGVKYYDKNGRTRTLAEKGNAEALKKQVADVLPKNYKQFADWLLNTMNDSVKAEYMNWYEQRFGKYNRRNEIGAIKENKYWSLRRAYEKMNSVEAAVSNPEGVFSNAKSRVNNDNAVMIGGALSTFTTYIDKLGTELYLKPIYREAIATLNTKIDGKSIVSTMAEKLDPQDSRYLTKTMDDMVGALKNTNDIFTGVMSRFSVAKLSLNLGTMGKQFASIFTSNIPIYSSVQGFVHRWSETFKNEYQTLIDGVKNEDGTWKTEPIGGLKYRNGSNIVRANADSLSQLSEKIAEAGMIGITGVDKFTINTGVFSLMMIGQNEFGLKVGTQANIDFVREQWHEFELSQIGSGALSKNALGRGDYGSLAKGLFGFLQGANRAALGSQLNKIDLWRRNRGLTKVEVENARDSARKAVTEYEESHKNKEGKFQTTELEVEEQERYVKLVAAKMDAEAKYDDFIKYRVAGGRAIPVNLAAGLIAQGLFVTLINELMKRIKGRKEWDEVDVAELGLNTALAIGVDWVPFVNTISSMIKGYDVQVPAVEIFKEIGEVLSNATQGNWQKTIRELALLIGDSTGIPFQTIYDYLYGTIKAFDVGTAEEFKSVLYGLTPQSATKTLNHYVEKKNEKKVLSMLNVVLDNYRVNTSDSVKSEMAKLLIDGKEVLPQQFMTSYEDENGEKVELSAEQIKVFRKYYDQADEAAQKLISSSSYKSLDNDRKAKLLKKLYSHYYAFAKYQVAKIEPSSRLGKLLVLTNGNLDLANYLVYLEDLGNIVATKTKTKKELAIKYINKISGKSKGEKLLLMLLAGYSVADNEKNKVIGQLVKLGMTRKQAKEFVG